MLAVQEIGTSSESRPDSPFFHSLSLSHMFSSPLKSDSGDLSSPRERAAGQDSSALILLCNAAKITFGSVKLNDVQLYLSLTDCD